MDKKNKKDNNRIKLLKKLTEDSIKSSLIEPDLYTLYDVKKGLRDINGVGVLAGLTKIGDTVGHEYVNGERVSIRGKLSYRGYEIENIVERFTVGDRFGFEETMYLLLFGERPNEKELKGFNELISGYRILPDTFVKEHIMTAPSKDMINMLARSVLVLYSLDEQADDVSIENVVRQSLQLIACFPMLAVYGYQSYMHYHRRESLAIHKPLPGLSTAENFLHMLRPDSKYTRLEAKLLDLALVLHAEHGGGNNSSFITHVATSTATDTYSVIAAALGSLKGPRHGGANNKVVLMFDDMKKNVKNWDDEEEIADYLRAILRKEAFDKTGLIYGLGHAVYSLSDPRAEILKSSVGKLAKEKGCEAEFRLYNKVEEIGPKVIGEASKIYKGVCANVDFYSGLVYKMLDIPMELYTSIFAVSRIAGWSAHRVEELVNQGKIIRPAYKSVATHRIEKKRLI
ncbi:MAG: citrate/2-methylcitrate synthase [Peptostreptococcaceae bacterium]|nr:citrate/2-methylcitrate synthase [Peptostreptococcaceae bacterium]